MSADPATPAVTVVVTTRDRPDLARRAVASVLDQTCTDVEVVVVDDGSRPPFVPAGADPRVRVVRHEVAVGVCAARNAGLAVATAPWIAFLDDDDVLEPTMVADALAAAAGSVLPPPVAVNVAVRVLDAGGGPGTVVVPAPALERGCDYVLEGRGAAGRSANGLVVPTAVLRSIGGFDEALSVYEHHDLGLRLNRVASIQGLAAPLYRMTADAPARLSARRAEIPVALERTRRRNAEAFARHRSADAQYLGTIAFAWLEAGDRRTALRRAGSAVVRDPASPRLWAFLAAAAAGPRALAAVRRVVRRVLPPEATVPGWALQRARLRKYGRRLAAHPRAALGTPLAGAGRALARRVADPAGHPVSGRVRVCCVYRARNAATVARLVTEAAARGWEVRCWALDRVAPPLAAVTVGVGPGAKFPLANALVGDPAAADAPEWVVVADDDVVFVGGGLADLLAVAEAGGLDFVQPAHVERSHRELEFTVRRPLSTARATTFVEIGPLFAVRRPWTTRVLPFPPEHTMGWGLELEWHDLAAEGMRLGIVDGVPIRHLSPVGRGYAKDEQRRRLDALLAARGLRSVLEVQRTVATWRPWQRRPPWADPA